MLHRLKNSFASMLASYKEANECCLEIVMVALNCTFAANATGG